MATEPVLTRTARIWMDDEHIVHIESLPGAEETIAEAKANVDAVRATVGNKRHVLLVDMRRLKSIDISARRFYAEEPSAKDTLRALGLVVSSPVSRIVGNFVIRAFSRSPAAIRMFTGEDEARAWLRGFVGERGSAR